MNEDDLNPLKGYSEIEEEVRLEKGGERDRHLREDRTPA